MAGVRRFDTQKALDKMVAVFWELGYEATSVDDLVSATGLSRSSLYGAFGHKEDIFLVALDHYLNGSRSLFHEKLRQPDLMEAVRGAISVFRARLTDPGGQPGCLLVLAAECAESRSPAIRRRVAQAFADEERAFYDRLRRAQQEGQLQPEADPRALARFLAAQGRAMAVNARVSNDPTALDDILDIALQALSASLDRAAA